MSRLTDLRWFKCDGDMALRIGTFAWNKIPLDTVDAPPQNLRKTVSLCLTADSPRRILWGHQALQGCRDGSRQTFLTLRSTPIHNAWGRVAGLLQNVGKAPATRAEARGSQTLLDTASCSHSFWRDVPRETTTLLAEALQEMSFMPICMREGCTEVAANRARRFVALPLQGPLSQVLRHCQLQRGEHVAPRMDVIPCGPYPEVTQSDYAVSMHTVGHEQVLRVLAGVGTRLLWNADDQNFIGRVGQSIRALICHARALRLQMARRCSALPEPVKSSLEVAKKQMEQLLGSIDHLLCAARPDKEPSSGPAAAPSDDPAVIPDFEHHQLERIFQSSPAAMALFRGPSLIFEKINRPYQEIFFARNLLGKPFLDALPEFRDQPFFGLLYRVFETGETFVGQEMLARLRPTPDGPLEDRYYDFTYVRIDTPRGEPYGVYVHATDVSQRVLWRRTSEGNQQRLEAAVLELTAERQMHETFVATLTHDLRTPLAAAQMSLQLLLRSSELSDKSMRYVQRAKDSVDRADEMISDLLDVSQIRAGEHLSLQMDPCELVSLTQRTLDGLANLHGPRFALQAPSRVAGYWNSSAIQRIIENLCSNAVKYGDPVATVAVHLAVEDENVSIAVHNEGPAIPMHERAHLFTPFRRARKARASGKSGWGLGLTLVRGLALAHGGTIDFRSEVDRGTTFCIRLPVDARPFQDIDANNATER